MAETTVLISMILLIEMIIEGGAPFELMSSTLTINLLIFETVLLHILRSLHTLFNL